MKKLAVAAVSTALLGAGLSAQQAVKSRRRADASTRAEAGGRALPRRSPRDRFLDSDARQAAAGAASAMSVDAQNKLVAQNCASCHSERSKAGELVAGRLRRREDRASVPTSRRR